MSHPASLLLLGLLTSLGNLPRLLLLLNSLDDTHSNRLLHVTHSKSSKRWVLRERLHTHWLGRDELNNGSIAALHRLRVVFELFATSTVTLLYQLGKLAGNVGRVAVEHRSIASVDLTGMVEDDHLLGEEGGGRREMKGSGRKKYKNGRNTCTYIRNPKKNW